MNLQSLYLSRQSKYDKFPDMITGSAKFTSPNGELTVNIRPEMSSRILAILAEEMVATTVVVAEDLKREILSDAAKALAAPKADVVEEATDKIPF